MNTMNVIIALGCIVLVIIVLIDVKNSIDEDNR